MKDGEGSRHWLHKIQSHHLSSSHWPSISRILSSPLMQENTHSRAPLPSWELLCHRGLPSPHNHGDPAYSKPNQKVTQNLCMTYFFASSPLQSFFEWFSNNLVKFCASLMAQLVKNPPAMQETWVDSWVGKIPWRRERLPTPVSLPGEFHGPYSPWGSQRVRQD